MYLTVINNGNQFRFYQDVVEVTPDGNDLLVDGVVVSDVGGYVLTEIDLEPIIT